jgi:YD repeat-containing protein
VPVTITGGLTHFLPNSTVKFGASGVTAAMPTASTATSLTVPVSVAANATLGPQGVTVVSGGETVTLAGGFTVAAGPPVITQVTPNTGAQGQSGLSVTITGNLTGFTPSSSVMFTGTGVTAGIPTAAVATSPTTTSLTIPVSVAPNTPLGPQGIKVVTGAETVTLPNAFTVTAGTPAITQVSPGKGTQGQSNISVTITGNVTHFTSSSSVIFTGTGVTAGTPTGTVTSTSLTVPVSITTTAPLGPQNIKVVSGAETVTLTNAFTVMGGTVPSSVTYTNDSQGRLTTATYISPRGTVTVTYTYDAAGNRTAVVTK